MKGYIICLKVIEGKVGTDVKQKIGYVLIIGKLGDGYMRIHNIYFFCFSVAVIFQNFKYMLKSIKLYS